MDNIEKVGSAWVAETEFEGEHITSRPFKTRREAFGWIESKGVDAKYGDASERMMTAAIVKGLIEHNDGRRFFGSTMNYNHHLQNAIARGILLDDGSVTACAIDWHEHHLKNLPQSRQVYWDKDEIGIPGIDPTLPQSASATSSPQA